MYVYIYLTFLMAYETPIGKLPGWNITGAWLTTPLFQQLEQPLQVLCGDRNGDATCLEDLLSSTEFLLAYVFCFGKLSPLLRLVHLIRGGITTRVYIILHVYTAYVHIYIYIYF